eukprot:CAMPEP_0184861220 /NCGR_PEP_ID=MMETSP0580-20130426/5966_1 /TAXON_ID=1118495 /ORGANISM="Dactyliosolen fragilissimus" /LENGTH=250 /DNA_ID=CAMNT_0027358641 /DNA_START=20 /DNA_END=772 /DNA_ORIENTATION=-
MIANSALPFIRRHASLSLLSQPNNNQSLMRILHGRRSYTHTSSSNHYSSEEEPKSFPTSIYPDDTKNGIKHAITNNNNNNNNNSNNHDKYISPYADFFDMIKRGQTSMGTQLALNESASEKLVSTTPKLKCGLPESVLRFRTYHYGLQFLAPFVDKNEHKVTLKISSKYLFAPNMLQTQLEQTIFHQIVGARYLKDRQELRLSSNQFASRIENKRHLCSMLDRIVLGAKRLAAEVQKGNDDDSSSSRQQA